MDETGHKRHGVRRWSWVMCSQKLAAYLVGQRRSKAVQQRLQGKNFEGVTVSDDYGAYKHISSERRQLCLAHIIRPLKGLAQGSGSLGTIAGSLVSDFQELFHLHKSLAQQGQEIDVFREQSASLRQQIYDRTMAGFLEHEELRPLGKVLHFRKQEVWNFVDNPLLPMTNNQAERDIRPLVMWRKSSQGSRSVRGDRFMERVQTVNQTCRKQNKNPFEFIKNALLAHWRGTKTPALLPYTPP